MVAPAEAAPDPPPPPQWIVGDLHVHVSPPDAAGHSVYTVETAIAKARDQGLDFVVLAPHDADGTFGPDATTGGVALSGQDLAAKLAKDALAVPAAPLADGTPGPAPRRIVVVPGWEFTRTWPGHQTLAFFRMADLAKLEGDRKSEAVIAKGGLAVVNHPFFRPVKMDPYFTKMMGKLGVEWSGDRSWKPFLGAGRDPLQWNAIEVWHERSVLVERMHAKTAAQYPDTQMAHDGLAAWDRATKEQRRRISAVGGSDCHGRMPYAIVPMKMTSVAVPTFDEEGLRLGLVGARVTFGQDGGAAARDFAATSDVAGARAVIGDTLAAKAEVRLTWTGAATLVEDGVRVGEFDGGAVRKVDPPGSFHFWRIEMKGDAYSNMIYANLPER